MKNLLKGIGAALGYVALYLAVNFIVIFVASFYYIFSEVFKGSVEDFTAPALEDIVITSIMDNAIEFTLIASILTLVLYLIIQALWKKPIKPTLYLNSIPFSDWWPAPLLGITLNVFISFFMTLLPIPENIMEDYSEFVGYSDEITLMLIISVAIVVPIFEEIMFRGLVMRSFNRGMPLAVAIILQAIVFGILHGHIISIFYTTFLGIILGVLRARYDSLYPCILIHMLFNGANFIMLPIYNILPDTNLTYIIITVVSLVLSILLFRIALNKSKNYLIINNMNDSKTLEHDDNLHEQDIVSYK